MGAQSIITDPPPEDTPWPTSGKCGHARASGERCACLFVVIVLLQTIFALVLLFYQFHCCGRSRICCCFSPTSVLLLLLLLLLLQLLLFLLVRSAFLFQFLSIFAIAVTTARVISLVVASIFVVFHFCCVARCSRTFLVCSKCAAVFLSIRSLRWLLRTLSFLSCS